jgi:hypothetical protein
MSYDAAPVRREVLGAVLLKSNTRSNASTRRILDSACQGWIASTATPV